LAIGPVVQDPDRLCHNSLRTRGTIYPDFSWLLGIPRKMANGALWEFLHEGFMKM
jgi:hypothetical protein